MPDPSDPLPAEPPLPAAATAVTEEGGTPMPPVSFWRQPSVQNVIPFAGSIAIHLALLIALILTYHAAAQFSKHLEEQIIIPDASLAPDAGGVPNPGLDQDKAVGQNGDSTVNESSGFSRIKNNLSAFSLVNTTTGGPADPNPVLPGAENTGGLQSSATGALAQFGNPGAGNLGPHGKVFGHGGNAMRIVYICDASGSMLTKMDLLKITLQKSVQDLSPVQAFDVVFFQEGGRGYQMLAPDLIMANAANKRKLYSFLDSVEAHGNTHVIPALTAVFNLPTSPDLIYLLTDGAFEDETGPVVITSIGRLDAVMKIKINPVLLVAGLEEADSDDMKDAKTAMQTIATQTKGDYHAVPVSDLGN